MSKKSALANINTAAAVKSVARTNAEKPVSKIFRVTKQEEESIKRVMFETNTPMQQIVIEGFNLWIEKNAPDLAAYKLQGKE